MNSNQWSDSDTGTGGRATRAEDRRPVSVFCSKPCPVSLESCARSTRRTSWVTLLARVARLTLPMCTTETRRALLRDHVMPWVAFQGTDCWYNVSCGHYRDMPARGVRLRDLDAALDDKKSQDLQGGQRHTRTYSPACMKGGRKTPPTRPIPPAPKFPLPALRKSQSPAR